MPSLTLANSLRATITYSPFTPSSLFTAGVQGAWYDPSDRSTLFQDAAGTTPVTAVEQPVGLMLDKSKGATLGPEMLTNGSFTTDLNGWAVATTLTNTVTWVSSGAARLNIQTTLGDCNIAQGTFVSGQWYKLSFTATLISGGAIRVQGPLPSAFIFSTTGNYVQYFQATSTGALIFTKHAVTAVWDITNVKIAAIPGNHAFQNTAASRPVLSARYNLLTKTEQFDDAAWTKTNSTVTANSTIAPDGTMTADKLVATSATGEHSSGQAISTLSGSVEISVTIKQGEWRYGFIRTKDSSSVYRNVIFDLTDGSAVSTEAGWSNVRSIALGDGWYRCYGTITVPLATNFVTVGATNSASNILVTGNGISGIYIWGASLVVSAQAPTAYQRVNTSTDYDTVGFKPYLKFDGVDDSLSTNSINFTTTDKMSVFAGVRKLVDQSNAILVELSTSAGTSNPGSFNLHAPIATGPSYASYLFGTASIASTNTLVTTYTAPITNVVTVQHDIAASGAAAEIRFRVNAVSNTGTSFGDAGTGNFGNYPFYIGRRANTNLPFNGQIYSMIIVGKAVTAGELVNLETYTNNKTGAY